MRWLVDGYTVIRRAPELKSREQESLEAGRRALCALLVQVPRASADSFTVVFDGAQAGGRAAGGPTP
jgi:predicted RNA-binding protein with PIN domain